MEIFVLVWSEENCKLKGSWSLSYIFHRNYYLEARNSTTNCLHQIRVYMSVMFFKKSKTSQVTTNKFNQLTISESILAMTLQDNTSSINCMQQLQQAAELNSITPFTSLLQQNHWGHDAGHGAQNLLSSHILQQLSNGDLQPEHQLIKSIASLQGNWSTKLLYYLCSVSAWDETYIRTGTA